MTFTDLLFTTMLQFSKGPLLNWSRVKGAKVSLCSPYCPPPHSMTDTGLLFTTTLLWPTVEDNQERDFTRMPS